MKLAILVIALVCLSMLPLTCQACWRDFTVTVIYCGKVLRFWSRQTFSYIPPAPFQVDFKIPLAIYRDILLVFGKTVFNASGRWQQLPCDLLFKVVGLSNVIVRLKT